MKLIHIDPETDLDLITDRVYDSSDDQYRHQVTVSIRRGRIQAVKPWKEVVEQVCRQIRLPAITLMPGLIDAHLHLSLDGKSFEASLARWQDPVEMEKELSRSLHSCLNHGITAVRDGGDLKGFNLIARDRVASGSIIGPQVVASGTAVTKKGLYGSFLGPGISSLTDLREHIRSLANIGADQVKITVSGIVTFHRPGEVGKLQFSTSELSTAVKLSHEMRRPVMAHVNSREGIDQALAAGVDSIEHGYFITGDQLKTMADRGIVWVPTIAAVANRRYTGKWEHYSPAEKDNIRRTYETQMDMIARAYREGVHLAVGTDAGAPGVYHGLSYVDELDYWVRAGIPPREIIRAATVTAAVALGLGDELGLIRPGYRPRMIAVKGDPLVDLQVLRQPQIVFIDSINNPP